VDEKQAGGFCPGGAVGGGGDRSDDGRGGSAAAPRGAEAALGGNPAQHAGGEECGGTRRRGAIAARWFGQGAGRCPFRAGGRQYRGGGEAGGRGLQIPGCDFAPDVRWQCPFRERPAQEFRRFARTGGDLPRLGGRARARSEDGVGRAETAGPDRPGRGGS